MTFIITLIALIIERFFHWTHIRQWRWFNQYQRLLGNHISHLPSWLILTIFILPLLIIVGLINLALTGLLFEIPKIIFGVVVLLYCMGPENLWVQTLSCINDIHKEDPRVAIDRAMSSFQISQPQNSQRFHRSLTKAIFIAAHERVFAVIFWFLILGPIGAVLYRTIALCATQSEFGLTTTASQAQKVLDWIPSRIFTLIFALGGHFVEVINVWKKDAKTNTNMNDKLISDSGLAALDWHNPHELPEDGTAEMAALDLLDRVFIMSLLILAVFVLIPR